MTECRASASTVVDALWAYSGGCVHPSFLACSTHRDTPRLKKKKVRSEFACCTAFVSPVCLP